MLGDPDSCGIWAPCLTYADGLFYLIYTDVKRYGRTSQAGAAGASLRDFHNYLVTSPRDRRRLVGSGLPEQQRLRPVALSRRRRAEVPPQHAVGSPARPESLRGNRAAGVLAAAERKLVGERQLIFKGTSIGFTEAPHLYKRNGYYYLITAEGGTGWGHAVTMARSRSLLGPVRTASRHLHPDLARSAGRRAAARGTRRSRRHAERRDLHGLSLRPAASQSRALHARARNGDPAHGLVGRRLAADARRRRAPVAERRRARTAAARLCRRHDPRGLRRPRAADRVSMAALAVAGRALQPDRAPRPPASLWPRDASAACSARRSSRDASSRTASAPARSSSSSRSISSRWPDSSATTTARSSTTSTSRTTRRSASICA